MKSIIIFTMAFLIVQQATAQSQAFDIVTFTAPKGWKKEVKDNLIAFSKTDKTKHSWCMISVIKSTVSKGSIEEDFKSEWDQLAVQAYQATNLQENEVQEAEGWKIKAGGGKFTHNKADAMVLLTTMSGYNTCVSIVATTNNANYLDAIQQFLNSVNLQQPASPPPSIEQPASQPPSIGTTTNTTSGGNFAYHTTNFDNGWTSEIKDEWVEVSKGDIKVFLWYTLPYNSDDFTGTGKQARHYYWDTYVTRYFTVENKIFDNGGPLSNISQDLIEGWATDNQTGQRRYIAMRAFPGRNIILITAADDQSLKKQFPKYTEQYLDDVSPMNYYNRFAIGKNDINGTWVDGGSNAAMMYYANSYGSGYVGAMTVASSDSKFRFHAGGNYDLAQKSTVGRVGALASNQAEYKGKFTVTEWTVTMTNRFGGKTEVNNAWFEAVRGGHRILHLQHQEYTGQHYQLVKQE